MLERALTKPQQCSVDPLENATKWSIPIWPTAEFITWLNKITASLKDNNSIRVSSKNNKGFEVKHLQEPYIKFESYRW